MEILNEDKNTHLEHLEDDIINNGYAGGQNAIAFLKSLSLKNIVAKSSLILL